MVEYLAALAVGLVQRGSAGRPEGGETNFFLVRGIERSNPTIVQFLVRIRLQAGTDDPTIQTQLTEVSMKGHKHLTIVIKLGMQDYAKIFSGCS